MMKQKIRSPRATTKPELQAMYDNELRQNERLSKTMQEIMDENQRLKKDLARYYPNKDARPLVILGNGPTKGQGLDIARSLGCELWGENCQTDREMTMLWQMHNEACLNSKRWTNQRGEKQTWWDFVKGKPPQIPVMMLRAYAEVPNSVGYPLRHLSEYFFGLETKMYSANSLSYMLAFAIWRKIYNPIFMYGVDYHYLVHIEAMNERPCTEFWIGWANAWNVKLHLPVGTMLLTISEPQRKLYGYELNPLMDLGEVETSLMPYQWNGMGKNGGNRHAMEHGASQATQSAAIS